jgi:hypothetical protein
MSTPVPDDDVLLDLLVKRSTEGLSADEDATLAALLRDHPELDPADFDGVVAALAVSSRRRERMPAGLRRRIAAGAPRQDAPTPAPARSRAFGGGWWTAAACFVLAVAGWWPRLVGSPGTAPATPQAAAAQRESLLARQDVVRVALAPGPSGEAPLTGDVVFDPVTQTGYLRFRGIPANDPRLAQYQLWIADGARAQPEPVDGGVFDVPATAANGDVIIPFRAKLSVNAPAAFVVTLEQPGGVVVSRQERVLALGKVTGTAG